MFEFRNTKKLKEAFVFLDKNDLGEYVAKNINDFVSGIRDLKIKEKKIGREIIPSISTHDLDVYFPQDPEELIRFWEEFNEEWPGRKIEDLYVENPDPANDFFIEISGSILDDDDNTIEGYTYYVKSNDELKQALEVLGLPFNPPVYPWEQYGDHNYRYHMRAEGYDRCPGGTGVYTKDFNAPNDYVALYAMYCHDTPTIEGLFDYFGTDIEEFPENYQEMLDYASSSWWGDGDDYIIELTNTTTGETLYEADYDEPEEWDGNVDADDIYSNSNLSMEQSEQLANAINTTDVYTSGYSTLSEYIDDTDFDELYHEIFEEDNDDEN